MCILSNDKLNIRMKKELYNILEGRRSCFRKKEEWYLRRKDKCILQVEY
jgi:hypothetical protein